MKEINLYERLWDTDYLTKKEEVIVGKLNEIIKWINDSNKLPEIKGG